jgi:hypothetical protein
MWTLFMLTLVAVLITLGAALWMGSAVLLALVVGAAIKLRNLNR